jgi:hypothetical protein
MFQGKDSMAKNCKLGSVAALVVICSIGAARPAWAQSLESLTVRGSASVEIQVYGGPNLGDYSFSNEPATLQLAYQPYFDLTMEIGVHIPVDFQILPFMVEGEGSPFTRTSGSGSFFTAGPDGFSDDYFIGSDGGTVADMMIYSGFDDSVIQVSFRGSTIPEPAAVVQMATAFVLIGLAAWQMRRRRSRPSPAQPAT